MENVLVNFSLDRRLRDRAVKLVPIIKRRSPETTPNMASILRSAIARGLEQLEKEYRQT